MNCLNCVLYSNILPYESMVLTLSPEWSVHKSKVCHVLVVINGTTEDIERVVELQNFDKEAFMNQLDVPKQSDPDMLDRYVIGPDDVSFVKNYLPESVNFDFSNLGYWIEAVTRN